MGPQYFKPIGQMSFKTADLNSLGKIYVTSDISEFNKIYENRFNSEASIKFPIKIKDNQCFFFYHNDISSLICN